MCCVQKISLPILHFSLHLPESPFSQKFTCWGKWANTYVGACYPNVFSAPQTPNQHKTCIKHTFLEKK